MAGLSRKVAWGILSVVKIDIPDDLFGGLALTPGQVAVDLAVGLYTEMRVTLGRAAKIAAMTQAEFLKELGNRRVPVHYDMKDLQADLHVLREISPK